MRQLKYSIRKLMGVAAVALFSIPFVLIIPMDERVASGQAHGIWATLFYEIGPIGRWGFAIAIIAILAFCVIRSIAVIFTDRVALRADERGIYFRKYSKRYRIAWEDVVSIDIQVKTAGRRAYQWIYVRARIGGGVKALGLPTSLLDAYESQVLDWISEAHRLSTNRRIPAVNERPPAPVRGFGRKPPLVIS